MSVGGNGGGFGPEKGLCLNQTPASVCTVISPPLGLFLEKLPTVTQWPVHQFLNARTLCFGKAWKNIPLTFTQACVCERDFLQPRHLVYSFLPFTGARNGEFPLRRFTTKHSEKSLPGLSTWQMRTLSFKAFILLLLFWWIVYQEDLAQGNVKYTEQASSFSQNEGLHEFRGYLFNPYCIFENRREPDTEPCWTPYLYSRKAVVASYPAVIVSILWF